MRAKIFSILSRVAFALGIIQLAWLALGICVSLSQRAGATSNAGETVVIYEAHPCANVAFPLAPYALLVLLLGLAMYLRHLARRTIL
jgi:hypothetical protein